MPEEIYQLIVRKLLEREITRNLKRFDSTEKNGWILSYSIVHEHILLTFVSKYTNQTIMRYFVDEDAACDYIDKILSKDPTKNVPQRELK